MKQPDILVFMSDQHSPDFSGWGKVPVDTPNLSRLRSDGLSFENAYTSCPLCVPARMSMMSGLLPSRTGVFTNEDTISDITPCFTHLLTEAGYETVLIGRMHFVGRDQRHGFTKRLAPDMTPVTWNRPWEKLQEERGKLAPTYGEPFCTSVVGAGESPVMNYDKMVVQTALSYLSEEHEKPQFIVVGTYGPHFPYVGRPDLYTKYLKRVKTPNFFGKIPDYLEGLELLDKRIKGDVSEAVAKGTLAAYCSLIEIMDDQIGQVRQSFEAFTERRNQEHVFCYLSDHGDQAGERRIFGKQTFFEKSARIPMIFKGSRIKNGGLVHEPVSILDLGPTLCSMAGITYDIKTDGVDLSPCLTGEAIPDPDRVVISQFMESLDQMYYYGYMLRYRQYKYISYHRYEDKEMLFDLEEDPEESVNIAREHPKLIQWFSDRANSICIAEQVEQVQKEHVRNAALFRKYEEAVGPDDSERWNQNPPDARGDLVIYAG